MNAWNSWPLNDGKVIMSYKDQPETVISVILSKKVLFIICMLKTI